MLILKMRSLGICLELPTFASYLISAILFLTENRSFKGVLCVTKSIGKEIKISPTVSRSQHSSRFFTGPNMDMSETVTRHGSDCWRKGVFPCSHQYKTDTWIYSHICPSLLPCVAKRFHGSRNSHQIWTSDSGRTHWWKSLRWC